MRPEIYRKLNVCFYLNNCVHCRVLCEFIGRINCKLPIEKQIKMVECSYYQKYGVVTDPLLQIYNKFIDGYPCIFLENGVKISGTNTRLESEIFLKSFFQDYFTIIESNEFTFNKNCEFNKKGIFKNKVVCN